MTSLGEKRSSDAVEDDLIHAGDVAAGGSKWKKHGMGDPGTLKVPSEDLESYCNYYAFCQRF